MNLSQGDEEPHSNRGIMRELGRVHGQQTKAGPQRHTVFGQSRKTYDTCIMCMINSPDADTERDVPHKSFTDRRLRAQYHTAGKSGNHQIRDGISNGYTDPPITLSRCQ